MYLKEKQRSYFDNNMNRREKNWYAKSEYINNRNDIGMKVGV